MTIIKTNNSRLERYFSDCHSKYKKNSDQSMQDLKEFYSKSFRTSRNKDTDALINQLNPLLPEAIDCIADNVMIYSSLERCIEDLAAEGFVVADGIAYDFVKEKYGVSLSSSGLTYVHDISSGKDLENIIADYKKSASSYLVAIGGGRTMDYAKYISLKTGAKLLAIPSSLATHVYASPKIHALDPIKDLGYEMTIDGNPAHLSLIDIELLSYLFLNKKDWYFQDLATSWHLLTLEMIGKTALKKQRTIQLIC